MTTDQPATILLFSWEPWGDMWYSKQHYAAELAKHHVVYFITPPYRWKIGDLFSGGITVRKTPENVRVVTYRNKLPLRLLPPFLAKVAIRRLARRLGALLGDGQNILWYFHPTTLVLQDEMVRKGTKRIYHVVDWYDNFAEDRACTGQADLVVAVNARIAERYGRINPRIMVVPHGISRAERTAPDVPATDGEDQGRPYLVLAGELSPDIDLELLIGIARKYPGCDLRIAGKLNPLPPGKEELRQQLLALPNVIHMGILHPQRELKGLIRKAKAGLIAYNFKPDPNYPADRTRTPLKTLTYLAQHLPVISSINCYIDTLEEKAIFKADDEAGFLALVEQALDGRLALRFDHGKVDEYLDGIEYGKLVRGILEKLDGMEAA